MKTPKKLQNYEPRSALHTYWLTSNPKLITRTVPESTLSEAHASCRALCAALSKAFTRQSARVQERYTESQNILSPNDQWLTIMGSIIDAAGSLLTSQEIQENIILAKDAIAIKEYLKDKPGLSGLNEENYQYIADAVSKYRSTNRQDNFELRRVTDKIMSYLQSKQTPAQNLESRAIAKYKYQFQLDKNGKLSNKITLIDGKNKFDYEVTPPTTEKRIYTVKKIIEQSSIDQNKASDSQLRTQRDSMLGGSTHEITEAEIATIVTQETPVEGVILNDSSESRLVTIMKHNITIPYDISDEEACLVIEALTGVLEAKNEEALKNWYFDLAKKNPAAARDMIRICGLCTEFSITQCWNELKMIVEIVLNENLLKQSSLSERINELQTYLWTVNNRAPLYVGPFLEAFIHYHALLAQNPGIQLNASSESRFGLFTANGALQASSWDAFSEIAEILIAKGPNKVTGNINDISRWVRDFKSRTDMGLIERRKDQLRKADTVVIGTPWVVKQ